MKGLFHFFQETSIGGHGYITKSTSRFARNTLDAIRVIRELKDMGVTVYFEKENLDTATLTSENLLTLYSLFAQEESLSISKNCKKGNRMRMEKGVYVSSNPPYGYRLIDNQLVVCEPEAEIIHRIFTEYLGGSGITRIAQGLMEDAIPFKDGRMKWRPQGISNIIKNERYVGDMLLQKTYSEDALPYRKCKNRGELPKYHVKNTHEPIVERIQYELANILLKERGEHINSECGEYPLSRKIRCKECGTAYRRKITNQIPYWVCRQHDNNKADCSGERIREDAIHQAFVLNTLFITIVGTLGTVVTSALVAYGFARFPSRWNGPLFTIVLATLMLPSQVTLIPAYMMYSKLGFVDTYLPLLLPAWLGGGAFNIFLLRQFIRGIPHELDEAAEIDGCGTFKIFYKILLPAMKPVLTTVGVMALIGNWNDFMGPLIYLNSESKYTIAIGLQFFNQNFGTGKMNYLMAVSILTTLPLIILFFCAQRYFVQGITMSGIKG